MNCAAFIYKRCEDRDDWDLHLVRYFWNISNYRAKKIVKEWLDKKVPLDIVEGVPVYDGDKYAYGHCEPVSSREKAMKQALTPF